GGAWGFAVDGAGLRAVVPLDLGAARLSESVERIRKGVETDTDSFDALRRFPLGDAAMLYRKLVAPVEGLVARARALVIVPQGPLFRLPFELLVQDDGAAGEGNVVLGRFAAARYFLEVAPPVRYALSATVLDPTLVARGGAAARERRVLALMNPVGKAPARPNPPALATLG